MDNIKKTSEIVRNAIYWFFAIVISMLLLSPYWVFGKYSAIGWYDESDFHIPILSYIVRQPGMDFWSSWAGGTPTSSLIWESNTWVSLSKILYRISDPWLASLLYRIFDYLTIAYIVFRLFDEKIIRISASLMCLVLLLSTGATQYGWQIGGLNFLFALSIYVVYFFEKKEGFTRIDVFIFGALIIFTGYPIYTVLSVFLVAILNGLVNINRASYILREYGKLLIPIAIIYCIAYQPYIGFLDVLSVSARAKNIGGLGIDYISSPRVDLLSTGWWSAPITDYLNSYVKRSDSINLFIIVTSMLIGLSYERSRRYTIFVLTFTLVINLLDRIKYLDGFGAIKAIRFDQIFDLVPFFSSFTLVILLIHRQEKRNLKYYIFITTFAGFLLNGVYARYKDVERTFLDIEDYGGFLTFNNEVLKRYDFGYSRFISNGYLPKAYFGPVNGFNSFDGIRSNSSMERVVFFHDFLYKNRKDALNPSKLFILNNYKIDDLNVAALDMANIAYSFSQNRPLPFGSTIVVNLEQIRYGEIAGGSIPSRLSSTIISPAISVLRLNNNPWGVLFKPSDIKWIHSNDINDSYIQKLKSLKYRQVLIPSDFGNGLVISDKIPKNLDLISTQTGFEVYGDIEEQLLVLNFEPAINMAVSCNSADVPFTRANLIFTVFYAPKGCNNVKISYH